MRTEERANGQFEERLLRELRALVEEQPAAAAPVPRRRSPQRLAVAAALAAAAMLVAGGLLPDDERSPLRSAPGGAWAEAAVRVAEAVPRLLISGPQWRVVQADEFAVRSGQMTFSDGRHPLDLHWRDGRWHRGYLRDRASGADRLDGADVAGARAAVFRSRGTPDVYTALWREAGYSLELSTGLSSPDERLDEQAFREVLESLRAVDVDTWLGAMPASVVKPDARLTAVEEMLEGVPVPKGFDARRIASGAAVSDRTQLAVRVTNQVACAWIDRWLRARARGDRRSAEAAVAAMATSERWPILVEMRRTGSFPDGVREYADAMAGDGTVLGGRVLTVEESYEAALGCRR